MQLSGFRPRFTIRGLMIATAVMAGCMGYVAIAQQLSIRRAKSSYHTIRAAAQRQVLEDWREGRVRDRNYSRNEVEAVVDWLDRSISHHDAMRRKWDKGARYPFLPVTPDPPEPK